MSFSDQLEEIAAKLKIGTFASEQSVSQGVVLPILHSLGWPVFDTSVVYPEYQVQGTRVDFALCHPANKPLLIIEVKKRGNIIGADLQLFQYAFFTGIPLAVLTDGVEWHFYMPAGQGDFDERRIYLLDILERPLEESTSRLSRYLTYGDCCSGKVLATAKEDYSSVLNKKLIAQSIPQAWHKLLSEPDELLIDLLSERSESICRFTPERESLVKFIQNKLVSSPKPVEPYGASSKHVVPVPPPQVASTKFADNYQGATGYTLFGHWKPKKNGIEVFLSVLEDLSNRDPSFIQQFASATVTKKRRLLALQKHELYKDQPQLCETASRQLSSGWWVGTNISNGTKLQRLQQACHIAGIKFNDDLKVQL